MRWVDLREVEDLLPPHWLDDAKNVMMRISKANDTAEQKAALASAAPVWQRIKPVLETVMDKKCWYCETRNVRSDNAVDHFRPKSKYWWLALSYENLRFSCTFCNSRRIDSDGGTSGGKRAEFPIVGVLATGKDDSLDGEEAILLDPCHEEDPDLLWFDDTGRPVANPVYKDQADVVERVKISIRLYHLDFGPLIVARRRKYLDVRNACLSGDTALKHFKSTGDRVARKQWWERVAEVNRLMNPKSPHSAAAKCAVLGLRSSSPTAMKALELR
jgi:uncharacterized protein (TIGR02646 family)